jgi:hypothetical protein
MKDYSNVEKPTKNQLSDVNLKLDATSDIAHAEEATRKAIKPTKRTVLVAWWDKKRHTGGPAEACSGDAPKCSADYARSHGASTRVKVNDGQYEFFYGEIPQGHEELMRDQAIELRRSFGKAVPGGESVGG